MTANDLQDSPDLRSYLTFMVDHKASDLFLTVGAPPCLKVQGVIRPIHLPIVDTLQARQIADFGEAEMFEKNIRLNRLENIEILRMGLFNQEDELNFLFAPDVSGATSLKLAGQTRGHASIQNVVCRTTTLDAFCVSRNIVPALLKIDVEGAELMVVQGGERILEATPIILMELLRKWSRTFGYHPNDVFALLGRYGYRAWVFVEGGGLEVCTQITEETVQTNYIFMHPQKHAETIAQWQRPIR